MNCANIRVLKILLQATTKLSSNVCNGNHAFSFAKDNLHSFQKYAIALCCGIKLHLQYSKLAILSSEKIYNTIMYIKLQKLLANWQ